MNRTTLLSWIILLGLAQATAFSQDDKPLQPVVQVEEDLVSVESPNNGSGPLWCYGSPVLIRSGERVFVSVNETGIDVPPLCNTRWRLWERTEKGWVVTLLNPAGPTRLQHGVGPTEYRQARPVVIRTAKPVTGAAEWFTETTVQPAAAGGGSESRLTVPAGGVRIVELTGG